MLTPTRLAAVAGGGTATCDDPRGGTTESSRYAPENSGYTPNARSRNVC